MTSAFAKPLDKELTILEAISLGGSMGLRHVQVFIDIVLTTEQITDVVTELIEKNIQTVILHLPDHNNLTPQIILSIQRLVEKIPERINRVGIIHNNNAMPMHFDNLPRDKGEQTYPLLSNDIPKIYRLPIAIENTKVGGGFEAHVVGTFSMARLNKVPFVFNIEKILHGRSEVEVPAILDFAIRFISSLDPTKDILNVSDLMELEPGEKLSSAIKEFSDNGGVVVLEAADLPTAIKNMTYLEM